MLRLSFWSILRANEGTEGFAITLGKNEVMIDRSSVAILTVALAFKPHLILCRHPDVEFVPEQRIYMTPLLRSILPVNHFLHIVCPGAVDTVLPSCCETLHSQSVNENDQPHQISNHSSLVLAIEHYIYLWLR
jgi:hypothetical protein